MQSESLDHHSLQKVLTERLVDAGWKQDSPLPKISLEHGETSVQLSIPVLSKSLIFDTLGLLRQHFETVKVHTISDSFCSFSLQASSLGNPSLQQQIKIRFQFSSKKQSVEISKPSFFLTTEIAVLQSLFLHLYHSVQKGTAQTSPDLILKSMGIEVFDPLAVRGTDKEILFEHIFGYHRVKREIQETLIEPTLNPGVFAEVAKFTRQFPSALRPRAVLFEGDPGVGKTTMARAVSCMTGLPMVYIPIESIRSKYYGESSQNLSLAFDATEAMGSCLLFLDEIDSLAGSREDGLFEETRGLLSVLLRKLDGFSAKPKSVTIGATNRKTDLDKALLSRFDKSIHFPLPDAEERAAILGGYARHLTLGERLDLSQNLAGYSGRNLRDFCDSVERSWALHLILSKMSPQAPPFSHYHEKSLSKA